MILGHYNMTQITPKLEIWIKSPKLPNNYKEGQKFGLKTKSKN